MDRPTVEVYEHRAADWVADRAPVHLDGARAFAGRVERPGPVLDAGCGPGWYSAALGPAVVALDAARAMLDHVPAFAPGAWRVQGDLARLPFARGALAGAYANRSYVHLPRTEVPLAWHDLHRSLAVGAPVELVVFPEPVGPGSGPGGGDRDRGELDPFPDDPFAGRRFSGWSRTRLLDVVAGAGFDEVHLDPPEGATVERFTVRATRARTLADTVGPGMRLLVVGLNPSLHAADAGIGFVTPGNRFWPAARAAGLVEVDRDPVAALVDHGIGMTDLVKRASPRAASLTGEEYRAGLARIERLADWLAPRAVCIVGLAGWRAAADRRASAGPQARSLGGRPVYVMPNPSGINASSSLADLTGHLRAAAALADAAPR